MKGFLFTLKNHTALVLLCGLLGLASCKKGDPVVDPAPPTTPIPPVVVPPVVVPPNATVYELGTGSGDLTIDGSTLKLATNALIKIKGGNYNSIFIKNIAGSASTPVLIKNDGQVNVAVTMLTDNITNVTIAGDNVPGLTYGFQFLNIAYRAITMNDKMSGVTIKSMSFKNVSNYTIAGEKTNEGGLAYDGTAATRVEKFKILNCLFDNAGSIIFGGVLNKATGEDSGLFKDVEIGYNIFQNSANVGTVCMFTNVQDYNIHHNVVNNINQTNNTHNGVFAMQGNGIFHDNKLTNYQGNSIRMWLYSRGSTPATNEIYNNICYNTRKYSGFELQGFDAYIIPGKTSFANAKVYNNTVGRMNTSKDWEGQVLDLYNYGGTLEYYNNLGFELTTNNTYLGITDMINNMSSTKIINEANNKYIPLQQDAVTDVNSFVSKISGVGEAGI